MNAITKFTQENRFLSNFFPVQVKYKGVIYPSVEHAYQAAKMISKKHRAEVATASNAATAKRLGRLYPVRKDWEEKKDKIMYKLVSRKFQNIKLATLLMNTGQAELIEDNWWGDQYWGVSKGKGKNKLGRILMKVRQELQDKLKEFARKKKNRKDKV